MGVGRKDWARDKRMQKMEDNHFDILNAEFKIVQKSIEMQLGMYDKAKSKD